jgi:hypothetical protein
MTEYKEKNLENISYIFGEQLFIGVIKFYRNGAGQIASTNWRMKRNKAFWYKYQDFYLDEFSFDERLNCINWRDLVVFRPAYVDGRKKAINVVKYQKGLHYDLALDNIIGDNVIHVKDNHRGRVADGRYYTKETTFEFDWDVNIYKRSGVHSYDVFLKCCDNYTQNGRDAFMWGIDSFFLVSKDKPIGDYFNTEKDKEAVQHMLSYIDSSTCKKLILKYPCFKSYAPITILRELVE